MITAKEVAQNYVSIGKHKANQGVLKLLILGILAGFFISVAGTTSTAVAATVESASMARLVNGIIFPIGLAMVLVAGSELFTGNCLMLITVLEKQITVLQMIRSWVVVYIGNFLGSLFFVAMCTHGHVYALFDKGLAQNLVNIAVTKTSLSFQEALIKGILCNILVCLAVWMSFTASTSEGKIITMFFPIMAFVICGFEHSVANMGYISSGLFVKEAYGIEEASLTWGKFFTHNLLPVTIGNIIGGFLVALSYWTVYLAEKKSTLSTES